MDFASPHIYLSPCDEFEQVSDDEFDTGMAISDSDSSGEESKQVHSGSLHLRSGGSALCSGDSKKPKRTRSHWKSHPDEIRLLPEPSKGKRWFRRADTNVMSVNFKTLLSPGDMHAGDPVSCQKCLAILSHISKTTGHDETKTWKCEFCGDSTLVDVEDEEIPKTEDLTYLLKPAMTTSHSSVAGVDDSLVIFCVDTSGSMCVTSEINGKVKLRGTSTLRRLESFNEMHENQYLPSQRRDVTYVSRLQAMQAAVDYQLGEMMKSFPNRRIALIAFCNEVCVVGDGSQTEVTIAGDKLTNEAQLIAEGQAISLPMGVKDSRVRLADKVYKLEEGGATALGPALVVALSMASHQPGSKVIVCTDGKANIGLGKMEDDKDEESANEFYTNIGDSAVRAGVTISVVTIQGTDCKLVHLGKLADKTGGQVNIVDPLKLREEFSNVLADPIIATKVKATFILYKDLFVCNEKDPASRHCRAEELVGNVTSRSVITFRFDHRKKSNIKNTAKTKGQTDKKEEKQSNQATSTSTLSTETKDALPDTNPGADKPIDQNGPADLPFQLQIEYTDTEGNQALRVITRSMPVTAERKKAEKDLNLDVLGVHTARVSSDMALRGEYTNSRSIALMNQRLAWRHSENSGSKDVEGKYKNIFRKVQNVENMVSRQQEIERRKTYNGRTYSDDESDSEDNYDAQSAEVADGADQPTGFKGAIAKSFAAARKKLSIKKVSSKIQSDRSKEMGDEMARAMYQLRKDSAP